MVREHAPSIIFMDEIDLIQSIIMFNFPQVQRTMLELLNQLDGFEATKKNKVKTDLCRNLIFLSNIAGDHGHQQD